MITDDQIVALLADAHSMKFDPDYGTSYHQTDRFAVRIEDDVVVLGQGDDFYSVALDLERLRAGIAAITGNS